MQLLRERTGDKAAPTSAPGAAPGAAPAAPMPDAAQALRDLPPVRRRLTIGQFARITRNQLESLPPETFRERIVHTRVFGRDRYHVMDPDLIGEALVRRADIMRRAPEMRRALVPLLGEGLLTAEDSNWRWQRRAVAAGFQPARLADMVPTMIAAAERTRDRWLAGGDAPLAVAHEMMRTTFDIIVETMFDGGVGLDVARVARSITDYAHPLGWVLAYTLARLPDWTPYPGRARAREATTYLRGTLARILAERRARPSTRADLVAMLLGAVDPQDGRTMSDEEIIDNLLTFVTAGHETTSLGLAWTFHLLAHHPEVEARLFAELDAVCPGGTVTPEAMPRLTYTRQVFSEAMRLYPPAPMISRFVAEDMELGGVRIPAGAMLVVPIYAVHHHALLWQEPERFDPDRFAPDVAAARSRYAYMPFGAGPRVCIGNGFAVQEAVAILAVLLARLRLRDVATAPSTPVMKVTLRPSPDLAMRAEARKPA